MAYRTHKHGDLYDISYICRYFGLAVGVIVLARRFDLDVHRNMAYVNEVMNKEFDSVEILVEWMILDRQ